jgi:CheY-like chemotaxis protein
MDLQPIYIVDDSEDYRFLLKHSFRRYLPHQSVLFFDGARSLLSHLSALNLSDTQSPFPFVIILDMNMPEINGYQTLKLIKQLDDWENRKWEHIPVVLNTIAANDDTIQECYVAGVNAILNKTADFNELLKFLQSVWLRSLQSPERSAV